MRTARLALALAALATVACETAKTNAYEREYERLERQAQEQRKMDEIEHAAAQKFAAVIYFATGSAALDADAQQQIRWFVGKMGPYPLATFDVQGFADSTGGEATNAALSSERAQEVSRYMQSLGIAAERIQALGFSTASPAASNATAEGRKNNRRVEVTVR
jgi:outer membrane protein OmpA-like peptidoglycan-associated protein